MSDLKQGLATPILTTDVVFYKRQLWTSQLIMFTNTWWTKQQHKPGLFMATHRFKSRTVGIRNYPMIMTCPVSKQ